jgi:hypothetical protein
MADSVKRFMPYAAHALKRGLKVNTVAVDKAGDSRLDV